METILTHFADTGRPLTYYDAVITGDLGKLGTKILLDLSAKAGADLSNVHVDCGCLIFSGEKDEYCGGSGCACGATTLNGYFLKKMQLGRYRRLLFVATGALLSPTAIQQKESIANIAHAVAIEREDA